MGGILEYLDERERWGERVKARRLRRDDQEHRGRLLLLGEGAALAHRLARPLAAELDYEQQS